MRKYILRILITVLLCMSLAGCTSEKYWIRENKPVSQPVSGETTVPMPTQIPSQPEVPTSLAMDGAVTEEAPLCFSSGLEDLTNDLGYCWERKLPADLWITQGQTQSPYSRTNTQYLWLDADPNLKNEPTIGVYLSEQGNLCEIATTLLVHDWTEAREAGFLHCAVTLLQCFWPDCEDNVIIDTAQKLRMQLDTNICTGAPSPKTVYVHGAAAAYGYTHTTYISINVIPVNDTRLRDLEKTGVEIIKIP